MSMHDLRPHVDMWHSFLKLIGYSVGGIIVILIGMALFLL
jgi:hypothetical protein